LASGSTVTKCLEKTVKRMEIKEMFYEDVDGFVGE
jgi:hypothetical protein